MLTILNPIKYFYLSFNIILLFFHNIYCKIFTKDNILDKINLTEMIAMSILKKEQMKEIPLKNYVYLSIILIASIFMIFYLYRWYETYRESKLNVSIMTDYLTVINYNELEDYIIENKNAVIYVSVLGNEDINKFENSFKNTIVDNNLKKSMLYLDVTNEDINTVKEKLKIDSNLPCIVVYTNGEITDTYSIVENNYNSKKIVTYLNRIGATNID